MPESGGKTTQSGILYQNSVAALFLGRLLDLTRRPDSQLVTRVRVEAPSHVDDTVVTYVDGHTLYIQAKEDVHVGSDAWKKLWGDFVRQFLSPNFQRGKDRLALYVGTIYSAYNELSDLCERASGKDDYTEWWESLNQSQRDRITALKSLFEEISIPTQHMGITRLVDQEDQHQLFRSIDIVTWTQDYIERDLVTAWMPVSSAQPIHLFRLLRDRVGGVARIGGSFTSAELRHSLQDEHVELIAPIEIDALYAAIHACGALLRQHKDTIASTGIHLRRSIVDDIVAWLREPGEEKNVAMLLDHAGMGKTVIMRDVLDEMDSEGIPVLAIKADLQLTGIHQWEELIDRLQLPEDPVQAVRRLASIGPVIVLIDQIDALSLSLARDQLTLNLVLDLIARLRIIRGVRLLISCRTFDYQTDPQLKRIDVRAPFHLSPLADDEIKEVLRSANLSSDNLPRPTMQLLRVPLHLDLYTQIFTERGGRANFTQQPAALTSLQDLYHLLWNTVVLKVESGIPLPVERVQVIQLVTQTMHHQQQTTITHGLFLTTDHQRLLPAVHWLASAGILLTTGTTWSFLHQTFYDYCYARWFVEQGHNLVITILESEQDLSARPQMIQILAYLRSSEPSRYLQALQQLLTSASLRPHLRDLLTRWFGALPLPTNDELTIARRLLLDPERRSLVLNAMASSAAWFELFSGGIMQELLALDDAMLDSQVVPYLASLIDSAQVEVVAILQPHLGRNEIWNQRVAQCVVCARSWSSVEIIGLLEQLWYMLPTWQTRLLYQLRDAAMAFPKHCCRLVTDMLLKGVQDLENENAASYFVQSVYGLQTRQGGIDSYVITEVINTVTKQEPTFLVEQILPWFERMIYLGTPWANNTYTFKSDSLEYGWYGNLERDGNKIIWNLVDALCQVARTDTPAFRQYAGKLAMLPYNTPQRLLAIVYHRVAEQYAVDGLAFLLGDTRRFRLGEFDSSYEARQLLKAIYPFLTTEQRSVCDNAIIAWTFDRPPRTLTDLEWRGMDQLKLLQGLPNSLLTPRGSRYLQEMERKFPKVTISDDPRLSHSGSVGSPIAPESAKYLRDRDWLCALQQYQGAVTHRHFLKGGADQLARVLQDQIKEQPERFYRLLSRISDNVDTNYVGAYLTGLADSNAPTEWLHKVIRRFASIPDRPLHISMYWALEKRAAARLPEDIRSMLETCIRNPPADVDGHVGSASWTPYNTYLNCAHGTAFRALMAHLRHRGDDPSAIVERWELIERVTTSQSIALRAGAIEELLYLLHLDRERAITLFGKLVDGYESLFGSHYAGEIVYHSLYQHFVLAKPFILQMMNNDQETCRQRGAEIACIAALSPKALETEANLVEVHQLAEQVLTGDVAWRRGAARIYSANIILNEPREQCVRALRSLLNDEDAQVCRHISTIFHDWRAEHLQPLSAFLQDFVASRAFQRNTHFFAEYLWKQSTLYPEMTLSLIDIALQNPYTPDTDMGYRSGDELIRSVLRVYSDPTISEDTRKQSVMLFDQLLERFPHQSRQILDEWDQR